MKQVPNGVEQKTYRGRGKNNGKRREKDNNPNRLNAGRDDTNKKDFKPMNVSKKNDREHSENDDTFVRIDKEEHKQKEDGVGRHRTKQGGPGRGGRGRHGGRGRGRIRQHGGRGDQS